MSEDGVMKKILSFLVLMCMIIVAGCTSTNSDGVIDKLIKKLENSKSYYIEGSMEIINNEDTYTYDVNVSYKDGDYYKVSLVNNLNNHEQVILRNEDGVYVVTH